jgi:type IV pilus assembly protein PilN
MARINLLPWRDELRKKREKQFNVMAATAVMFTAAIMFGVHLYNEERIAYQQSRNQYMEQQIQVLETRIKKIKNLDGQRANLLARMEIIQQLQASRPEIVRVFDELITTLPEGVFYDSIKQSSNVLVVSGVAQSNAFVSSLMRNINSSIWLKDPALRQIVANRNLRTGETGLLRLAEFKLQFKQASKSADEDDRG